MKFIPTAIPEVLVIEPRVIGDHRGFFMETWRADEFDAHGIPDAFVQDNHSKSSRLTLRGVHYQVSRPQGKLIRVLHGEVFDVAVDMRRSSPFFGQWVSACLSAQNNRAMWIPPGFAHGFLVLSEAAELAYKCTDYYHPESERRLLWNDPVVGIEWPLAEGEHPVLSVKDRDGESFQTVQCYP